MLNIRKILLLTVFFFTTSIIIFTLFKDNIFLEDKNANTRIINELEVYKVKNKEETSNNTSNVSMNIDLEPHSAKKKYYEGTDYPYFLINSKSKSLNGIFNLQVNKNTDLKLIALKGNDLAPIRLPGDKDWYSNLKYSDTGNNSLNIPFEINTTRNKAEDLLLIPIINDQFLYSGEHSGVIRLVTIENLHLNNAMINEQAITDINIESFQPRPTIQLTNKDNIVINEVIKGNEKLYLSDDWSHLLLTDIMYETSVDVLWLDETGNTKIISKELYLNKGKDTIVNIQKKDLNMIKGNPNRQFFIVVNNRNQKALADSEAFNQNKKPTLTSFQIIKEILPTATK
jgi:hypothetical protein